MHLGMRLARVLGVAPRVETVTVGDVSVMRRFLMRPDLVMLGGFVVMMRRLAVVFGGEMMMLDCLLDFRHSNPPGSGSRAAGDKRLEHLQ